MKGNTKVKNTTLEFVSFDMPCQDMNGVSSLPALSKLNYWHRNGDSGLSEDDGLFIGYGHVPSAFPYRMQDMYTRELKSGKMNGVVLENSFLKAVFLPEWGGKLMSLYDKELGRDLLFTNPVMRPCNLAIRNAWTSGGVEWNCGIFGHNVHTCDTMFTTTTHLEDGTPVLRMYEYERIRRVVQQMDFFLPEDSRVLFARCRIINPCPDVVPMYWWSNIAVPETPDTRIIVNADTAYVAENNTSLANILNHNGDDVTYPINVPAASDYFYNIPENARKFEAALDADGYGLIQTSTRRLIGRKLFCWGQNPGGDRWQEYLTADGSEDRYIELQAGIAHTQYECVPMPPNTTWEWLEAYGAMNADGDTVHGEWQSAKDHVAGKLNEIITEEQMDSLLAATKKMATSPADGALMFRGAGWGALENILRDRISRPKMAPHLDFGEIGEQQADWLALLDCGAMPEHDPSQTPVSWMLQKDWTDMMRDAASGGDSYNWYTCLQLGTALLATGPDELVEAERWLERSLMLKVSCWGLYSMAQLKRQQDEPKAAAILAMKAAKMAPDNISIAKEAMELLIDAQMNRQALELAADMPPKVSSIGRVKIYIALAHVNLGHIEEAEKVLYEGGGIVLPDIREGELIITDLWLMIEELKAKRDGRPFDKETAKVPPIFDYRQCETKTRRPPRRRAK